MAITAQPTASLPQTSLYVGDLHPLASEAILHTKFSQFGPVLSARICRDMATRNSLGYGYVNFENRKDAELALENLNYEQFLGRPVRLMWSQRDPSLRKSGRGNIFIKNLDKSIGQKELHDTLGVFGSILSCKIATDEAGRSKGYGFIHYDSEEAAEKAISTLNNMLVKEKQVYVGHFIPRSERKSASVKVKFNNIYVKNFTPDANDDTLRAMFTEFGEIKSCCVEKDAEGKSKGFGFVCFANPEDADRAVQSMHGKDINGRILYANRAQRKEERQEELKQRLERQRAERQSKYLSGVNLYVKNLDDTINDERLRDAFVHYGPITSAKVMTDTNGRSKGFGFVCFTQPEVAARAVTEMNATLLGSKPLYVALAQRKEDRRAKLIAEHQQRMVQQRAQLSQILPAVPSHATAGYFPPAAFQPQRFFNAQPNVINQPRYGRSTQMAMPNQLNPSVNGRTQMAAHYFATANPSAALPNAMAMAQMRSTNAVGRAMMGGIPTGPPMPGAGMINQSLSRQQPRAINIQQVMPQSSGGLPQRPSMASVVAAPNNINPALRPQVQMPRGQVQPGMSGTVQTVRFNQMARNINQPIVQSTLPAQSITPNMDHTISFLIKNINTFSSEQKKTFFGSYLFPIVAEKHPNLASKITGMLVAVDDHDLIDMLENKDSLMSKIQEGVNVLSKQPPRVSDGSSVLLSENNQRVQNGDIEIENSGVNEEAVHIEGVRVED